MDDDMANLLVAQLLYLDSLDPKRDITMYVNSPGGSVTAGGPRAGSGGNEGCSHAFCRRGTMQKRPAPRVEG